MKSKMIPLFFIMVFLKSSAICQDTSQNQKLSQDHSYIIHSNKTQYLTPAPHRFYRDTRLGGSSAYFNTYKKNDYGAGAITTNPRK